MKRPRLWRLSLLAAGLAGATILASLVFDIEETRHRYELMRSGTSQWQVKSVDNHFEGWMDFDAQPAFMTIGGDLGGCCPYPKPNHAYDLVIALPAGQILPPLRVEAGECHVAGCTPSSLTGSDYYVLVDPEPGNYTFRAYPVSGREANPVNIYVGGLRFAYYEQHPVLRGDNVWWYYPDGSREFVEDGNYSHFWATLQWGYVVMFTGFGLMAAGLVPWPRLDAKKKTQTD